MTYHIAAVGDTAPGLALASVSKGKQLPIAEVGLNGTAYDVAFSPDGTLCAVGHQNTPFLTVYDTSTWTKVSFTPALPAAANGVTFSPDGTLCAVAHQTTPYLTIYDTSTWTKVSFTPALPSTAYGVTFSPDGTLCAVAHQNTPQLTIYNTSTWTKVSFTPALPSTANGVAFSPDGTLCAVAHQNAPFLTVYNTNDWSKVSFTPALPNTANGVAFSPDGTLCAVAHQNAPFLTVYNTNDWSKVSSPFGVLPASNNLRAVAFHTPPARIIRGNVRDIDGDLASRRVRVYDRMDGALCGSTTSDPITGEYEVLLYEGDVEYDVQFMAADGENLNDLIYARTQSGAA